MLREWLIETRGERPSKEVAAALGISKSYYSLIEAGKRRMSVEILAKVSKVLDISTEEALKKESAWLSSGR